MSDKNLYMRFLFKEEFDIKENKILKDLVKFNTIKDKENRQIIDYIEKYLLDLGFETEYKEKNLIMSIGNNYKFGFLGHTDTVEYIDGWDTNPFELTNKDGKLYGLGACDMKGGIAAILDAVSQIDLSRLQYGMKLYFTYDEEIGFGGVYDIVDSKEVFPEFVVFGEPTNNEILVGSKGLLEYELDFIGLKAHSSNPAKGISANINAMKFLMELDEFYQKEIKGFKDNSYEVPYTTMNVGIINGGSAKNSVPANCNVAIDFRIAKKEHINEIIEKVEQLSSKYSCKVNIIESIDPFKNKVSITEETKTANFMTEASFVEVKNKVILGVGPVTAHEVNEYITQKSYDKLVDQYVEIIEKICN